MQRCSVWPAVAHADSDEDIVRRGLGVLYEDIEISIVIEHAGIDQFVLWVSPAALVIRSNKIVVRIGLLRVFVEAFHVRVGRRGIEVEVVLLHILPVIALAIGQAEQSFLEDRVLLIPQGNSNALPLFVIAKTSETVLAPMVGARPRVIVREIVPCVAVRTVIFADGSPLALAEIWSPLLPTGLPIIEAHLLGSICTFLGGRIGQ